MTQDKLDEVRAQLDRLDRTILDTVAERQRVIDQLGELKAASDLPLRDAAREQAQLTRLVERARELGLSAYLVKRLFRELLEHSVRTQEQHLVDHYNSEDRGKTTLVVSYQGTDGAYSQLAAEQHFAAAGREIKTTGYHSFYDLLQAVASGAADYGMLPIENTTAGSVTEAYDRLAQSNLSVVGEEVLRVEHCLVALPGVTVSQLRRVYSHPQALAQCATFLSALADCAVESYTDTAMSVTRVRDEANRTAAAVASERAAELYGLEVIARNIANQKDNFTRFMVVARTPRHYDERIRCKTSLIFSTHHEQGALVRCLNVLADAGLNLTKLESRPMPSSPFEYLFYVDFEGNVVSESVADALDAMRAHTSDLRVLGSYPSRAIEPHSSPAKV